MTRTKVPPSRPEGPRGEESPVKEPRRDTVDKIAPPAPGVGRPLEAPIDPNRRPDRPPERGPSPKTA